ncbi:RICIN domain-containing protein [Streptomyces inusitatus]|uniref:RICIN domain-containing protein n=1 Tax=Streptomyces inusitatus TaxID=68221 RepID=UPI00167EF0C3|nr:RICIN domain-containing protein [Streptomyces inusitatus]
MTTASRRSLTAGAVALMAGAAMTLGLLGPAAASPGAASPAKLAVSAELVTLRLASDPGQVADVAGASGDDGAEVVQWALNGQENQRWEPEATGSGYYRFKAEHSGKCLNVRESSHEDGARIIQWPCGTDDNEQWKFVPKGIGYQLVVKSSGKCLNVEGGVGQGRNLIQYTCSADGETNDVWLPVLAG